MAAPVFIEANTMVAEVDASLNLTLPGPLSAGDIVIVAAHNRDTSAVTINTPTHATLTFAPIMAQSGGNVTQQRCFWARCSGGETGTVTLTKSSGTTQFQGTIYSFSGCKTSGNPYDGTAGATQEGTGPGTSVAVEAMTIAAFADSLGVGIYFEADDDVVVGAPTGTADATYTVQDHQASAVGLDARSLIWTVAYTDNAPSATTATQPAADQWSLQQFVLISAAGTAHTATPADTLTLADSATTESGRTAAPADTLTLSDSLSSAGVFARTLPDTLALADALAFARAITITDSLAVADSASAARGIAQAVDDTLALSDSATTAAGKAAQIDDTLSLADSLSSAGVFQRAIPDTLSLADSLASAGVFQRALDDTLALSDSLAAVGAFIVSVTDSLALSDLADPVKGVGGIDHSQPVDDTLSLADAQALARGLTVADTLSLADLAATAAGKSALIADTLALADALRFDRTLVLAESLELADALASQAVLLRSLADTLTLADAATAERGLVQALDDLLSLADSLASELGRGIVLEDTLALLDELETLFTPAVGEAPLPTAYIDFPNVGRILRPTGGSRAGSSRARIDTPDQGVLARTTRGAP